MIRVAIAGAAGRMGQMLVSRIGGFDALDLTVAHEREGFERAGDDIGAIAGGESLGVSVTTDLDAVADQFDVLVDFTIADATAANIEICRRRGKKMVIGTTGLSAEQKAALATAAHQIAIVFAPNFAVGVNVTFKLAEIAAAILGQDVDVEIIEAHHRHKVDAPSGTALGLGEAVAKSLGRDLSEVSTYGRGSVTGERDRARIGFHSIRAGEIVGDHTVLFASEGERLELTHRAQTRVNFADGALRAAAWVGNREAGQFDMQDVLGLNRISVPSAGP